MPETVEGRAGAEPQRVQPGGCSAAVVGADGDGQAREQVVGGAVRVEREQRLPSSLKMTSWLPVWLMLLIFVLGSPTKIGPDQLAATLGSALTLRTTELIAVSRPQFDADHFEPLGEKPAGNAQFVHVPAGVRSRSTPVSQATYRASVAPA